MDQKALSELRAGDIFKVEPGIDVGKAKLLKSGVYEVVVARRDYGKFVEICNLGHAKVSDNRIQFSPERVPIAVAKRLIVNRLRGPQ